MCRTMATYPLALLLGACLLGCAYGGPWTRIDCLPEEMAGKVTIDEDWVCEYDMSCTCTVSKRDCYYCDPWGIEKTSTSSYDSHGVLVSATGGGCDCRHYCEYGVQGPMAQRVPKATVCVRNPTWGR